MRELQRRTAAARKKFQGFKPGKVETIRTAKVQMDPQLEKALRMHKDLIGEAEGIVCYEDSDGKIYFKDAYDCGDNDYQEAVFRWTKNELHRYGFEPTKDLIERLAITLGAEYGVEGLIDICETCTAEISGLFLSALIDESRDDDFTIHTVEELSLMLLGYKNRKNITLVGEDSHFVGNHMLGGTITIRFGRSDGIGFRMEGGRIIIEGDFETNCGELRAGSTVEVKGNLTNSSIQSRGGKIIVHGNLESCHMESEAHGEIHVSGEIDLGYVLDGGDTRTNLLLYGTGVKIFQRGELVWPKDQ